MKVLLIGSGGREHTIAWKLQQSSKLTKLFVAPGNAGTSEIATNVNIKATDINELLEFAKSNSIDLTIVGPEQPLAMGIVDLFKSNGLRIFGPNKEAAKIESSKAFSKDLMKKYNIPTAKYETFNSYEHAISYVKSHNYPLVIKADGLAAGKGVIIAQNYTEAEEALTTMMLDNEFGSAGNEVVIEEFLVGEEVSLLAFTDGESLIPMVTSQDHKQAFDGDKGPNTGGMGTFSPAPVLSGKKLTYAVNEIMKKTVQALKAEGINYSGVLYGGLIVTSNGVKVIEFNCRFGDPETQVIIPRLKSDLLNIFSAVAEGKLNEVDISWYENHAVCVVLASGGYPKKYIKGYEISGLNNHNNNIIIIHAGTKKDNKKIITSGGRVLGVTALAPTTKEAINKAYEAVGKINFKDMHYRKDIGTRNK